MDIAELDRESAELLPDRQALGCWNYGWHNAGRGQGWDQGCGHESWVPRCNSMGR